MTQTLEPPAAESVGEAQQRIDAWLTTFNDALASRDIDRITGLFATSSFWRDLVAFTWNIKTVEGHDEIVDMLRSRLGDVDPKGFATTDPASDDGDGVVSAFIRFETAVGRGEDTCGSSATRTAKTRAGRCSPRSRNSRVTRSRPATAARAAPSTAATPTRGPGPRSRRRRPPNSAAATSRLCW